jgi:hypothetical protein
MVKMAIENGTMIFVHENATTRFYGYRFETINNEGSWETKISRTSYNLDENGKLQLISSNEDQRAFRHLKEILHSDENILSDTLDEMRLLSEEVWLNEKAKHQETILLGLFDNNFNTEQLLAEVKNHNVKDTRVSHLMQLFDTIK